MNVGRGKTWKRFAIGRDVMDGHVQYEYEG